MFGWDARRDLDMQHGHTEDLKPRGYDDPLGRRGTSIYIAHRVGQRLLLALFMHRVVAVGVILALLVLGLFWLREPRPGQAPVIGALPVPVSVQPLAASSGGVRLLLKEQNGPRERPRSRRDVSTRGCTSPGCAAVG
jgi:hypothetical protein